jgi:hypothetical protein
LLPTGLSSIVDFHKVECLSSGWVLRTDDANKLFSKIMIDWLFTVYVPLKNFSRIWRRHHCRWRAAKFRPMLGAQDLWAGRDLYLATPAVTRGLGFSGLIRRTAPFSRLLGHTRGCGGSILTRILTGIMKLTIKVLFILIQCKINNFDRADFIFLIKFFGKIADMYSVKNLYGHI